jgi:hypothetical protein
MRHGRWTIMKKIDAKKSIALCDCGTEREVWTHNLKRGVSTSCGCGTPITERFWSRVAAMGDCWEWTAGTQSEGYGRFYNGTTTVPAHRYSHELVHGPIAEGLEVCHRCDNPHCVRPDHLFVGTHLENMQDRHQKGRYATGDDHWSRKQPDKVPRGVNHWRSRRAAQ